MDETRIPWWLVLLLGIGVAGLAIWQSGRWKLQLRIGAGMVALVYMALLALAVCGPPRTAVAAAPWRVVDLLAVGLSAISLTAAMLLTGRPPYFGQLTWFGVVSLANSSLCILSGNTAVAGVLAISGLGVLVLAVKYDRAGPHRLRDLWPSNPSESNEGPPSVSWLSGLTGVMLATLLIGTSYHALHAESSRASFTRRHSALPSRARIRTVLEIQPDRERTMSVKELGTSRADVAVLLAILVFVALACRTVRIPADE